MVVYGSAYCNDCCLRDNRNSIIFSSCDEWPVRSIVNTEEYLAQGKFSIKVHTVFRKVVYYYLIVNVYAWMISYLCIKIKTKQSHVVIKQQNKRSFLIIFYIAPLTKSLRRSSKAAGIKGITVFK